MKMREKQRNKVKKAIHVYSQPKRKWIEIVRSEWRELYTARTGAANSYEDGICSLLHNTFVRLLVCLAMLVLLLLSLVLYVFGRFAFAFASWT